MKKNVKREKNKLNELNEPNELNKLFTPYALRLTKMGGVKFLFFVDN